MYLQKQISIIWFHCTIFFRFILTNKCHCCYDTINLILLLISCHISKIYVSNDQLIDLIFILCLIYVFFYLNMHAASACFVTYQKNQHKFVLKKYSN